jgi:hypothetical protein
MNVFFFSLFCCSNSQNPKPWDDAVYNLQGPAVSANPGNQVCRNHVDDSDNNIIDDCTITGCEFQLDGNSLLPDWYGLCHKWVPASLMEPEPQHPFHLTTDDNILVPFQVSDIKGLAMTLDYPSIFFGTRCELDGSQIPRDRFGRIDNQACRDTNAGAFHVVLVNYIAREGRGFGMDRTWDAPVWNQPIVGFHVEEAVPTNEVEFACGWIGGCDVVNGTMIYNWNNESVSWVGIKAKVFWVSELAPSRTARLSAVGDYLESSDYKWVACHCVFVFVCVIVTLYNSANFDTALPNLSHHLCLFVYVCPQIFA